MSGRVFTCKPYEYIDYCRRGMVCVCLGIEEADEEDGRLRQDEVRYMTLCVVCSIVNASQREVLLSADCHIELTCLSMTCHAIVMPFDCRRLKDILKSIAVVEKDPVMGTVFVLKK